jgi:hypothetical protein
MAYAISKSNAKNQIFEKRLRRLKRVVRNDRSDNDAAKWFPWTRTEEYGTRWECRERLSIQIAMTVTYLINDATRKCTGFY